MYLYLSGKGSLTLCTWKVSSRFLMRINHISSATIDFFDINCPEGMEISLVQQTLFTISKQKQLKYDTNRAFLAESSDTRSSVWNVKRRRVGVERE